MVEASWCTAIMGSMDIWVEELKNISSISVAIAEKIVCACICMNVSYCIISSLSFYNFFKFYVYPYLTASFLFFVCVAQASVHGYCQAIWHVDTWIKTPPH